MTNRNESIPVDSEADWLTTVVEPARIGLAKFGIPVNDLSDDQVLRIAQAIDELGAPPSDVQVGIIVDRIAFESKLVGDAGGQANGASASSEEPAPASPAPRSADCDTCIPHKMPFPSGWYLVHSRYCVEYPAVGGNYIKIRPVGVRSTAKETQRLLSEHAGEDARSGVITRTRPDPYRDVDGRDVTPEDSL